jgi:hypothetical protein
VLLLASWRPDDKISFDGWRPAVKNNISWLLFATLSLLTGCTGIARREDDQSRLDRYMQYAGAPIDHFTYLGRYDGWQVLGRDQLVVWTSMDAAYLLTVAEPCTGLEFAERIGVSSTGGTVSHFESIRFDHQRCPINEIRPVDYRKMRRDLAHKSEPKSEAM